MSKPGSRLKPRRDRSPRLFPPEVPPPPPDRVATTIDKGHGRLEIRTLRTTTRLTLHQKWPGLRQGFEVTRERIIQGVKTVAVVLGITSLSPEEANATRLLELVRQPWRIENCLHWVRDVTLGEDACRGRKDSGPEVLAGLRNVVVHLLTKLQRAQPKVESRLGAAQYLAAQPNHALEVLGFPQRE